MKIALIGATGQVGSRVLAEALGRGHQVTAIARQAGALEQRAGLRTVALDVTDGEGLAAALAGHDAVVISVKYSNVAVAPLLDAVRRAGVPRVLLVGGAGSLQVAPGVDLVDTPDFPAAYKPEALAAREALRQLRSERTLDWTLLSPSAFLQPGQRTGTYRVGSDSLLTDAKGESRITIDDLAHALVDELEQGKHHRSRFTVGY